MYTNRIIFFYFCENKYKELKTHSKTQFVNTKRERDLIFY